MKTLLQDLEKYHLTTNIKDGVCIHDMLNEETCRQVLEQQMKQWGAPHQVVAASMFIKRYAVIIVASTLYSMVCHKTILPLNTTSLVWHKNGSVGMNDQPADLISIDGTDRIQQRKAYIHQLFAEHITPLIEVMAKSSGIKQTILWENVAVRINSVYRKSLAQEPEQEVVTRIYEDFHFLKDANGAVFGLSQNPIQKYLKIGEELKKYPERKTCCLYHRLDKNRGKGNYCANCPLI